MKPCGHTHALRILAIASCLVLPTRLPAGASEDQTNTPPGEPALRPEANPTARVPTPKPAQTKSGNEWILAPVPSYDPSQGFGLRLAAQYVFHPKGEPPATPPSVVGANVFYTQESSWGVFAGYMGHVKNDLWRPAIGAGYLDYHYDYYGTGNEEAEQDTAIPVEQLMTMAFGRLMYRVYDHLYAGLSGMASLTKISAGATLPPDTEVPGKIHQYVIGPALQWDTRDNQFFPTKGTLANLHLSYEFGDYSFGKFEADWNRYLSFKRLPKSVLALRAVMKYVGDDAPFFALSQFGQRSDLRGYIDGKYRDNALLAAQAEWRQSLAKRWIVVVFAGIGEVEPRLTDLSASDILASAGAGIRYRLGKKNPINFRLDWAYGKDGDAWYFSVGEAY